MVVSALDTIMSVQTSDKGVVVKRLHILVVFGLISFYILVDFAVNIQQFMIQVIFRKEAIDFFDNILGVCDQSKEEVLILEVPRFLNGESTFS